MWTWRLFLCQDHNEQGLVKFPSLLSWSSHGSKDLYIRLHFIGVHTKLHSDWSALTPFSGHCDLAHGLILNATDSHVSFVFVYLKYYLISPFF